MNWKACITEVLIGALAAVVLSVLLIHHLEHVAIAEVIRQLFGGQP